MRILFVSKYAATASSGKPTRQYFFAKQLASMGHEVNLIYSRSNMVKQNRKINGLFNLEKEDGLKSYMLNGPRINLGFNLKRVWSWILFEINLFLIFPRIKKDKPDLIIVSSLSILTFVFGVFVKRYQKIPLVIEVRDLYPLGLIEIGGMSERNIFVVLLKKIERFGYQNADLLISSLENTKSYFTSIKKEPVNFLWLPMGYHEGMYSFEFDEFSNQIINQIKTIKERGYFIVGYAGTLGLANALDDLMELTNDKQIQEANIYFVFIGSGPLKDTYLKKYKNTTYTSFFPSVKKKFLPSILANCDILINTWQNKPIYNYGVSPNKWIDYMFSARPVLLSLSAESKIFNEANFGWQIPGQNINQLRNSLIESSKLPKPELDKLGKNGKKYLIENLNYTKLSAELILALENCISKSK